MTVLAISLLTACGSNELTGPTGGPESQTTDTHGVTRLVFGQYYGFCPPTSDCAQVYKVEGNKLYEDQVLRVLDRSSEITFKASPLAADKYDLAKSLAQNVPAELLKSTEEVFGSPDAHDQGGIVLEVSWEGATKRFYLDNNDDALPPSLVPYAQEVKRVIAALK